MRVTEAPTLARTGNVFRLHWPEEGVAATVRRLHSGEPYVRGEVVWASSAPGEQGHIHQGLLSLNSSSSKTQVAKVLAERHPDKDWSTIVEQLAVLVLGVFRRGEPVAPLVPGAVGREAIPRAIEPLFFEGQPHVLFGEPGTMKSYLGLLLALLAATGGGSADIPFCARRGMRPLYLDWESTRQDQADRLGRLERGLGLRSDERIAYRYCTPPLSHDVEQVQEAILDLGVDLVVIDSLGPAAGGDLNSAESAQDFFAALRTLQCTSIILAHVAKNADPTRRTIFGSQFFNALARGTAEIKRHQEPGADSVSVGIYPRKSNLGRLERPLGLTFTFAGDEVRVRSEDVRTVPDLADGLPLRTRITELLAQGSLRPKEVADLLAVPGETLRKELQRLRTRGQVLQLDDGRYALTAKEQECPF